MTTPTPATGDAGILITPERPALVAGHPNAIHVLVRVQAPAAPPDHAHRTPRAIALVLDRSGSMSGQPLKEALACAADVVERLAPDDRAMVVSFDHTVSVDAPLAPVGDRSALKAALQRIHAGGNTALFDGWQAGASALATIGGFDGLRRVMLLSDGQANHGLTDPVAIAARCASAADTGVSTSTYGLSEHFNEDLMVAMARAGRGSHYYGRTAADLYEPFMQELDLLGSLWARAPRLRLATAAGVVARVLNDCPITLQEDGSLSLPLTDIAYGSEAWVLVQLRTPLAHGGASTSGADGLGSLPLLSASLDACGPDGASLATPAMSLTLPTVPAQAFDAIAADELVVRRLAEVEAARLLQQVRDAAAAGRWRQVDALIAEGLQRFAGNPWVAGILDAIQALARDRDERLLAKEATYARRSLDGRLAALAEAPTVCAEAAMPSYVRRKTEQGRGGPRRPG